MSEKKIPRWIPVLILVLLVCLFAGAYFLLKPDAAKGAKHIFVEVTHLNGETASFEYDTDAEYLREVLCEEQGLISGSEEAYGLWIKTVDGETADETKQQWWGYSVNGEQAMYGVEQMPVTDGDTVSFVLNEGY